MRRDEQLAPARAQRGILRVLLERRLEESVRGADVAGRARRVGLDARIRALRRAGCDSRPRPRRARRDTRARRKRRAPRRGRARTRSSAPARPTRRAAAPRTRRASARIVIAAASVARRRSCPAPPRAERAALQLGEVGVARHRFAPRRAAPRSRRRAFALGDEGRDGGIRRDGLGRAGRGEPRDREAARRAARDLRVLGRERAVLLEAVGHAARGVVERLLRRDRAVLVDVGRAGGERRREVLARSASRCARSRCASP